MLVCWAVRFLITGGAGSDVLEGHYGRSAKQIHDGQIPDIAALASAMIAIVPPDQAFRSAFSTARISKAQLARYYLRALQLKADGQEEPQYVPNDDASDINLEHVLPQSPSNEWPGLDADTLRANANRIGNLVLLQAGRNRLVGSSSYETKNLFCWNLLFPSLGAQLSRLLGDQTKYRSVRRVWPI
jgi:hypothetical protein